MVQAVLMHCLIEFTSFADNLSFSAFVETSTFLSLTLPLNCRQHKSISLHAANFSQASRLFERS